MHSAPLNSELPPRLEPAFRARRIKQIIMVALAAVGATAATSLQRQQPIDTLVEILAAVLLLWSWRLVSKGRTELSTTLMLVSLTGMVTVLIWQNGGLHDPGMLGFPGILIFASMLGSRRLLLSLLGFMIAFAFVLLVVNTKGWHVNETGPVHFAMFLDVVTILSVTGFSVWLMANDLHQALKDVQGENERVRESQARIEFIARHDALTGLPNRTLARQTFERDLANARRHQQGAALLYLDLDDFKAVNDSLGHGAGDELLQLLGRRLQESLRETDTVCRLGGDEFLILLGELHDGDDAVAVAGKVQAQFAHPFMIDGLEVVSSCSIGISVYPGDGGDFDTLLKKADTAMYSAKDEGRNAFRFFDAEMNAAVIEHVHLAGAMRSALARDEFVLHYQPQFDLATGAVIGAEALIRWRHQELGIVPPGRFIPIAEKSGLIVDIGAWVLREACRQAAQWRTMGLPELVMSVNVSPMQFRRGDIEVIVMNALGAAGLPPAKLELELTESLLLHDSITLTASLDRLRRQGVAFSIDDFGTGYSNLGYLKRFEVERLKIDQSFVRRMSDDPHDEAIVRAIIQMSQSLKLQTIAEGVEDEATMRRLAAMGCMQGQGFLWSPALPADEFLAFARAHASTSA